MGKNIHFLRKRKLIFGGGGRIRTHGRVAPTAVFKTAALNHSATPPFLVYISKPEIVGTLLSGDCYNVNLAI